MIFAFRRGRQMDTFYHVNAYHPSQLRDTLHKMSCITGTQWTYNLASLIAGRLFKILESSPSLATIEKIQQGCYIIRLNFATKIYAYDAFVSFMSSRYRQRYQHATQMMKRYVIHTTTNPTSLVGYTRCVSDYNDLLKDCS